MANEVTVGASLAYNDGTTQDQLVLTGITYSPGVKQMLHSQQQAPTTTATALNLGSIATPGPLLIINRDPTNYVSVRATSGGTEIARLLPGGVPTLLFCGTGMSAPYLLANTASCWCEYILVSA